MILLPLFLVFIFLFSFVSQNMMESYCDESKSQKSFIGYKTAHRELLNEEQKYLYQKRPRQKTPKKEPGEEPLKPSNLKKGKTQNRTEIIFSRFNIWGLFQENSSDSQEALFLKKLIKNTYQNESWYPKNFENYFLEILIKEGKEQLKNFGWIYLEKISFPNQSLKNCYYHILKGSFDYNYENNTGYPSILELITIDPSVKKNNLPRSRIEILAALFTKSIAEKIYEFERKESKFKPLNKEELLTLLKNLNYSYDPNILDLFSFEQRPKSNQTVLSSKDKITNIYLTKKLYPSLSDTMEMLK